MMGVYQYPWDVETPCPQGEMLGIAFELEQGVAKMLHELGDFSI